MKKKVLVLLFSLISICAVSQVARYNPTAAKYTISNKPYGPAQGVPTDARSMFYDTVKFVFRPYMSTTEVINYLNLAKYREGRFPILINSGGIRNSTTGILTGGVNTEYWFAGCTADSCLGVKLEPSNPRWFSVKDYGATGWGVTSDRTAITAAIAAAENVNGGVVYLPDGTYLIDSTIVIHERDIKLIGSGKTIILSNFAAGDILFVRPDSTPVNDSRQDIGIQGLEIKNIDFQSTIKKTSGYAIHTRYTEHAVINNIRIGKMIPATYTGIGTALMYDGIWMEYFSACNISQVQVYMSHIGMAFNGAPPIGFWAFFNYDGTVHGNVEIWGDRSAGSIGVLVGGQTGGLRFEEGNVVQVETGLRVDTSLTPGFNNRELFLGHFFWDSCDGFGIDIASGSLAILKMDNGWIAGTGRGTNGFPYGSAIHTDVMQPGFQVQMDGVWIYSNMGSAIDASGGQWSITGCKFYDNGLGPNGGDGIAILAADQVNINIVGNSIVNSGNSNRGMGIRLNEAIANYTITGNTINGSGQAPYSGAFADGASKILSNNSGVNIDPRYPQDHFNASNDDDIRGRLPSNEIGTWEGVVNPSGGLIGIRGNQARLTTSLATYGKVVVNTYIRDIEVRATVGAISPVSPSAVLMLAVTDNSNYLEVNTLNGRIKQIVSGVESTLDSGSGTSVPGDVIKAILDTSSLVAYRNGVEISSATVPTTLRGTKHGIFMFQDSVSTLDNFETYSLVPDTIPEEGFVEIARFLDTAEAIRADIPDMTNVAYTNAANTFTPKQTISGFSTTDSKLRIGSVEIQPYSLGNAWIGENVYFNGTNFVSRATGASGLFYFQGNEGQFRFDVGSTAGTPTTGNVQMKVNYAGDIAMGGNINSVAGNYTGAQMVVSGTKAAITHLSGRGSAPGIAAGTGAGTGPTVSIVGSDLSGEITVLTGTSPSTSAIVVTMTFATTYEAAPYVTLTASNDPAIEIKVGVVRLSATQFQIKVGSVALDATTTYKWNYSASQ